MSFIRVMRGHGLAHQLQHCRALAVDDLEVVGRVDDGHPAFLCQRGSGRIASRWVTHDDIGAIPPRCVHLRLAVTRVTCWGGTSIPFLGKGKGGMINIINTSSSAPP